MHPIFKHINIGNNSWDIRNKVSIGNIGELPPRPLRRPNRDESRPSRRLAQKSDSTKTLEAINMNYYLNKNAISHIDGFVTLY